MLCNVSARPAPPPHYGTHQRLEAERLEAERIAAEEEAARIEAERLEAERREEERGALHFLTGLELSLSVAEKGSVEQEARSASSEAEVEP